MKHWFLALIAANLVGIVALVFVYPDPMLAPGELIPAHASFANDCFACHAPLQGAVEARCTTCHEVADIGVRTVAGVAVSQSTTMPAFHQGLADTDCMGCHTDHRLAGLTPVHSHTFDHAMLTPAAGAACASCHTAPKTSIHEGITAQCSTCHSQKSWSAATFEHRRFFALTGPHDVACSSCHTTANDFSEFTCFGCHEHQEADLIREHREEGIRNIDDCAECHRDANAEGGEGREGREGHEEGEGREDDD
jgi:hypothetical protein